MHLSDFTPPSTAAARAARELAAEYSTPSLFNHAVRSWIWAEALAVVEGRTGYDRELLYVSALLHDVGLAPEYDNAARSYEEAGGHVAKALTAGAGWSAARRERALEVIVRHNWPSVDPAFDLEGHLLESATALDISGAHVDRVPEGFRREVLDAYPRLQLGDEFTACVVDQANRKPTTAARRLVDGGVARKLAEHPLERA